jgi:division protein CdvB (Snf7/Vps24/ESCRT-III family)
MARLDEAQKRLNAAITRLERAVEAKAKASEAGQAWSAQEIEALKAENDELRRASSEAGQRLDTAIERLQGVLGEER